MYTLNCIFFFTCDSMPVYSVPAALFPALAYASSVIKDGVPNRWKKIQKYLEQFCSQNPATINTSPIKVRVGN